MANATHPILQGFINSTHTSNMYAYYPFGNLPTPWPLVVISSLVSLVVALIGFKTATITWNDPTEIQAIRENAAGKSWMQRYRENKAAMKEHKPLPYVVRQQEIALHEAELHDLNSPTEEVPRYIPIWPMTTSRKVVILISFLYSSARAVIALILSLTVVFTRHGSHSASSSLLLLLLSIQTFLTNRAIPRIMNIVLVLDSVFAASAFLIASFDRRGQYYGELALSGGNCPVYASSCHSQAHFWSQIGCGSVILPDTVNDGMCTKDDNPNCESKFYPPYGDAGDLNTGLNALFIVEMVIAVFGAFWLVTVLVTIYEARWLFTNSLLDLLRPVERNRIGKKLGWRATVLISVFGILGAFGVTIMTIAAHMSQELRTHHTTYIDSFGPTVQVNWTMNSKGIKVAPDYGGNATSWSDCFTLTTPSSSSGFWDQWMEQDAQSIYRLVAAL